MSGFYNYDTRGASQASQIINLERMVEERDRQIEKLQADLAAARAERDELRGEMEHLSDMVSAVQELEKQSCAIIRSVSDDVSIMTPTRDYSVLSPLECYEAGLLDGGAAVRAHIHAAIDAALAGEKK